MLTTSSASIMESGGLGAFAAAVGTGTSSLAICPAWPVSVVVVGMACDGDAVLLSAAPCSLADRVVLALGPVSAMFSGRADTREASQSL